MKQKREKKMTEFVSHEMGIANAAINNQFRVFSLKTKTFYPETEEFFLSSAGDCLLTKTGERLDLKENVILACTGVKDIKGRPIFHGDVLKTDEGNWAAAVVWGDGRFCLEDERGGFSALPPRIRPSFVNRGETQPEDQSCSQARRFWAKNSRTRSRSGSVSS